MNNSKIVLIFLYFFVSGALGGQTPTDPALLIVNKQVSLGTYKPKDLVLFDKSIYVSKRIIQDLKALLNQAKKAGFKLKVVSGYRSYQKQIYIFNYWTEKELKKNSKLTKKEAQELANTYSAKPGHSEHQLGTAVDILSSENNYNFSADKTLKYISWLAQNCEKYNFKVSYPENNTQYTYEPWHVRWYPPYNK